MKRRRTFLIVFAILIVILIVGLIALWLSRGGGSLLGALQQGQEIVDLGTPQPTPTPVVETEPIVVALQTIPRGMAIPPDAVEIREWPKTDEFPDDAARRLESVVGRVARVDILRQRPVLNSMVTDVDLGTGAEMALGIPKGKVAFPLPVKILSAVANALRPGDRVDVLLSFSVVEVDRDSQIRQPVVRTGGEDCLAGCQLTGEQLPRLVSQYSVQNARVLAIGLWQEELPEIAVPAAVPSTADETAEAEATPAAPQAPTVAQAATQLTSVTLVVSPQDALVLKWALETNASIHLVMRSAVDQDIYAQPEAVTLQYMLDRFQISVPPKLPYAPENKFESQLLQEAQESAPASGE
jgi:Flp pilus assembly protein CpaB